MVSAPGREALRRRALGVAAGLLLDRALGEPPARWHPVVWFGTAMRGLEGRLWRDARPPGVAHAAVGVSLGAAFGAAVPSVPVVVALTVAGRELRRAARAVGRHAVTGDLGSARDVLPTLVGRDPSALDASGICAAVLESLAENTVDAVVAPALWGLLAGAPGAAAYRAVNTMDAMVGHRGERYGRYGWAGARLDDLATLLPARAYAVLLALVEPARAGAVVRLVRRDAASHPSPNAGVAETAMAAVLGRELGGPLRYGSRAEDRPRLGDGPRPQPGDIDRAVRVSDRVELALVALTLGAATVLGRTPRRSR